MKCTNMIFVYQCAPYGMHSYCAMGNLYTMMESKMLGYITAMLPRVPFDVCPVSYTS